MFPWMQSSVNPLEVPRNAKVELQGLVLPEGPLLVLDGSLEIEEERRGFGGTTALGSAVVQRG